MLFLSAYFYRIIFNQFNQLSMKKNYEKPRIEIINVENEGVIAGSAKLPDDYGNGGGIGGGSARSRSSNTYKSSTTQDLEDLINDLFTIEK